MSYFYTYYSYEPWGRGYIGKRECKCLPEEDFRYKGSFKDKTFKPTEKIILEEFGSCEEALDAEIKLHHFFEVDKNPHFANKARQTSTKFYMDYSIHPSPALNPEVAKKISAKMKGNKNGIGHIKSEEVKEAIAASKRGKPLSNETKQKISQSLLGNVPHNLGKPCSENQKKQNSEKLKGRKKSPEIREKMVEAQRKRREKERAEQHFNPNLEVIK
jgi:hypothetical protein